MRTLHSYRIELKALLPRDSFLHVDRGSALFVSDAPRRCAGFEAARLTDYQVHEENGLLYITPIYDQAPQGAGVALNALLKSDDERRDRIIRQNLALSMRLKRQTEIRFWEKLLFEGEAGNEN